MLYQTRYNPTSKLQEFLEIEYAWSHMCCNLLKNDLDFTLYNSSTNKYLINQKSIKEFEKLLNEKTKNHNDDKEHKISTDCKIIKDNWCNNSGFPNKEKQELQSKITNILEKINENFDEIKGLTDPQIAYEYYVLLMKYKLIAAFTQNTMDEILFFGNEKLLDHVQALKKQRKQINDDFKKFKQHHISKIKAIENEIRDNKDEKDLKAYYNESRASANLSEERINELLKLNTNGIKKIIEQKKEKIKYEKEIINKELEKTKKDINKINEYIKNLTGTVEDDEDEDEEVAEGKKKKKKKKTKKKRKAGRAIILSNYPCNTKSLNPKSMKSVKSLESLISVKSNFNYNYNCFILSLLLNEKYQPSAREIKQIIQNKFV